jgi:putative ABC transport system permease protein
MLETFLTDLRFAVRSLRHSIGFASVAVLSLALGIGASGALFSLVDAIFFRPLPVHEPDRLVALYSVRLSDASWSGTSYPDYLDYREQTGVFAGLMAYIRIPLSFDAGGRTELLSGEHVTSNYFETLGLGMPAGRGFRAEEDRPGAPQPVVVISDGLWQRAFGGDPSVVGRPVRIQGRSFTIVGVAPRGFRGVTLDWGEPPQVWLPMGWFDEFIVWAGQARRTLEWREARSALVVGRLQPGVTLEKARTAVRVRATQLQAEYPETNRTWSVEVLPGREARFWPAYRRSVAAFASLLTVTVGFVLLLACANVANLQLARGAAREREIALRLSLGASRRRLVLGLLVESLVLSVLGLLAGFAIARGGVQLLSRFPLPFEVPLNLELGVDRRVLLFTLVVSLLATVMSGLFPALATARADLRTALQEQAGSSGRSFRNSRLRSGLVVAEVALSLVLLAGAGLFVRTLIRAQSIDLGLRLDNVLVLSVDFNSMRFRYDEPKATQFYRRALERVRSVPGVVAATWGGDVPLARRRLLVWFVKDGTPISGEADWIRADVNVTGPRYLETLGIRLVRGRDFTDRDNETSPIGAAIINETMARRYWPGEDPLGRRLRLRNRARELYEIVGIAGDVRQRSIWGEPAPYLYVPVYQRYFPVMMLHVRIEGNPMTMLPVLERELAALDPDLPVFDARTLRTQMAEALAVERTAAMLLGAAGLLALVLAVSGVYSIMAYSVARRTREIGIRMALGAHQRAVLAMILKQGMTLAVFGILAGIGAAWVLSRLIAGYLHGASPTDPLIYASVVMILAAAAALACYLPSRRAARIDPATALRRE